MTAIIMVNDNGARRTYPSSRPTLSPANSRLGGSDGADNELITILRPRRSIRW